MQTSQVRLLEKTNKSIEKPVRKDIYILRGIGIIFVVLGHVIQGRISTWFFLFHMPLFFFLSGTLYRDKYSVSEYIKKKLVSLMLPYVVYLGMSNYRAILGFLVNLMRGISQDKFMFYIEHFKTQMYGGDALKGDLSTFWFITCLFFTQQIYHILNKLPSQRWLYGAMLGGYILSLLNQFVYPDFSLPLSINAVGIALIFFHAGQVYQYRLGERQSIARITIPLAIVLTAMFYLGWNIDFNMKGASYGIPVVSIIVSMLLLQPWFFVAKGIEKIKRIGPAIAYVGQSSLTILFLHQQIKHHVFWNRGIENPLFVSISTILICLVVYYLQNKLALTRLLFLGVQNRRRNA